MQDMVTFHAAKLNTEFSADLAAALKNAKTGAFWGAFPLGFKEEKKLHKAVDALCRRL